jgi:hypothetical protein
MMILAKAAHYQILFTTPTTKKGHWKLSFEIAEEFVECRRCITFGSNSSGCSTALLSLVGS